MTSVILAASEKDHDVWNRFSKALSSHFTTMCSYGKQLTAPNDAAEFVITDTNSYQNIVSESALIIFRDTKQIDMELITKTPVIAIVDSCNKKLLPFVSSTKLPAITCGLSNMDTITLSSIGEDRAVVNLQRSITCLDGTVAEPQEIPMQMNAPVDNFVLMAVAAVFILSGNIDNLFDISL